MSRSSATRLQGRRAMDDLREHIEALLYEINRQKGLKVDRSGILDPLHPICVQADNLRDCLKRHEAKSCPWNMADRLIVPSPEHIAARAEIEHHLRQPIIAAIVTKMADTFTDLLRCELSADEFREMQVRNTAETSRGVCHSHDFLDANALMEIAFIETTG